MRTTEEIILSGDLTALTDEQRIEHYKNYCASLKIDPLKGPFQYVRIDDAVTGPRTVLYALRNGTDQLREVRGISIIKLEREEREGYIAYKATAQTKDGRTDIAIGAVSTADKKGRLLANADMHADTKARQRVTLDICGLGLLCESEIAELNSKTIIVATPGLVLQPTESLPEPSSAAGTELSPEQIAAREAVKNVVGLPSEAANAISTLAENMQASMKSTIDDIYAKSAIADTTMPTPKELVEFRKRMSVYTNDVLAKGGLVASDGMGVNAKIQKFFMRKTGAKDSKSLTKVQWESTLTFLDEYVAKHGAEGLVKHVEETIA